MSVAKVKTKRTDSSRVMKPTEKDDEMFPHCHTSDAYCERKIHPVIVRDTHRCPDRADGMTLASILSHE